MSDDGRIDGNFQANRLARFHAVPKCCRLAVNRGITGLYPTMAQGAAVARASGGDVFANSPILARRGPHPDGDNAQRADGPFEDGGLAADAARTLGIGDNGGIGHGDLGKTGSAEGIRDRRLGIAGGSPPRKPAPQDVSKVGLLGAPTSRRQEKLMRQHVSTRLLRHPDLPPRGTLVALCDFGYIRHLVLTPVHKVREWDD
jgi:hypothetical protein